MQEYQDQSGNGQLNYAVSAEGKPSLLLLHGVTRRWQSFLPVTASLSQGWNVCALDFRGHGNSSRQPGEYLVRDYVEDALRLIDMRMQERVVIYGHSLGSMVAAAVAAELGDKVAGIVLEDPPLHAMGNRIGDTVLLSHFSAMKTFAGDRRNVAAMAKELAEVRLFDPVTRTEIRLGDVRDACSLRFSAACLKRLDPEVFSPIVNGRWLDGFEIESIFQRIQSPILLLQADITCGGMLRDDDAELIQRLATDVTRIKLNSCGHLVHWTRTTELLNLVHAFLETLDVSLR